MSDYNHKKIEEKWNNHWYESNLYEAVDFSEKPKKFIMAEFPYPSGKFLHAGHMMRYTVPDVYSRYLRMNGYNVMFPMAWDAFGLPAENHAIETGVHPAKTTEEIIKKYRESFRKMGYGIDWSREFSTTDPKYYKWTQWIFLKFFEQGLAEYKETPIWWCEDLKTVLSDEEVLTDKDGNKISERGEKPVEKKMLKQWVLKIPEYAEKLIDGLSEVDFPEAIKNAQIHWIGKSEGAEIDFDVDGQTMSVFTTRPDTIYGVTFMVIAPEHPFINTILDKVENKDEVAKYVNISKNRSNLERQVNKDKTGVELGGIKAIAPFTNREIPIFVSDYVLMDYGTGFVMGVPAHDERDFEFAKKYDLDVVKVIEKEGVNDEFYDGEGLMVNSESYSGITTQDFRKKVTEHLEKEGKGRKSVNYKIRDWVFSRQRYWGEPIPLVRTEFGEILPICDVNDPRSVDENLPLELPKLPDYSPSVDGTSPLERNEDWVNTEIDGVKARRETNTMPNWAGSCWYYMRYTDPKNDSCFADMEKMRYWLPVDRYFGGAEHTTMHLLYSRFWHKFLYDQKLVPTEEPYNWRMNGGILLGSDGTKMSKSKGNVVEPSDLIDKFGADSLRMTVCFIGPYEDTYPWSPNSIKAVRKLLKTIYDLKDKVCDDKSSENTSRSYNRLIKNVTQMSEDLKMNTSVSEFMIFINKLKKEEKVNRDMWSGFVRLLAPFAPFLAEELWSDLYRDKWNKYNSVHLQEWPKFDRKLVEENTFNIPIQVNGKVRSQISVDKDSKEDVVKTKVLEDVKVIQILKNKELKKFIYVPNKVVNLVI